MKTKFLLIVAGFLGVAGLSARLLSATGAASGDYVAHEWGTFTSVQGGDGIPLAWNPRITTDLPKFVYDYNRELGRLGALPTKAMQLTLQRMETPVIYFYSEEERKVDVEVGFPQGLITEWYPQVTAFGPSNVPKPTRPADAARSFLSWKNVEILPAAADSDLEATLPQDGSSSHYFAARETDAAVVRVPNGEEPQQDKFLFYRGVGNFEAPLKVQMTGNEQSIRLDNGSEEPLRHLMVLTVGDGEGAVYTVETLEKEKGRNVALNKTPVPMSSLVEQVSRGMVSALTSEGLYRREAEAMVKTWRDSWFEEKGVRVLYILPRGWTDRTLPLEMTPAPRELVRVMVGRAEVIRPSVEWALLKQIVHYSEGNDPAKLEAVNEVKRLRLGRFSGAALRRLLGPSPYSSFSKDAWSLLNVAMQEDKANPNLFTAGK